MSCNVFCHFYFTCCREKGSLFNVCREIGKKNINVHEIVNCSFIVIWQFYFAFFRANILPLRPSLNTFKFLVLSWTSKAKPTFTQMISIFLKFHRISWSSDFFRKIVFSSKMSRIYLIRLVTWCKCHEQHTKCTTFNCWNRNRTLLLEIRKQLPLFHFHCWCATS